MAPRNDKARKWSKPTSGLHGRCKTVPYFADQGGYGPCRWKQEIAPFGASSEDKEQVPNARGIKGPGGVCFSFPLAITCGLQADSLYLCSRRDTNFFAIYFGCMTKLTKLACTPHEVDVFCCAFAFQLYVHTVFILSKSLLIRFNSVDCLFSALLESATAQKELFLFPLPHD